MTAKIYTPNDPLQKELNTKDSPLDEIGYSLVEYSDIYSENGNKKFKIKQIGEKFASINSFFLEYLKEFHIPAGFIKQQDKNALKFVHHNRLPFVVRILNIADKRTSKLFSIKENEPLGLPIMEYHLGGGKDSLISDSHIIAFDLCSVDEIKLIARICSKVNAVLKSFFERRNEILAEVTCSFGKAGDKIYVVDEFTPRSLKIIPVSRNGKWINPYKLNSSTEVKKYTDHLITLMST